VMLDRRVVPRQDWAVTRVSDGSVLDVQAMMVGG